MPTEREKMLVGRQWGFYTATSPLKADLRRKKESGKPIEIGPAGAIICAA
jgi:hypothetical protein